MFKIFYKSNDACDKIQSILKWDVIAIKTNKNKYWMQQTINEAQKQLRLAHQHIRGKPFNNEGKTTGHQTSKNFINSPTSKMFRISSWWPRHCTIWGGSTNGNTINEHQHYVTINSSSNWEKYLSSWKMETKENPEESFKQ